MGTFHVLFFFLFLQDMIVPALFLYRLVYSQVLQDQRVISSPAATEKKSEHLSGVVLKHTLACQSGRFKFIGL